MEDNKPYTEEEQAALERYESAQRAWERFCAMNPDLVEHMEDMIKELKESLDALETHARRGDKSLGPFQKTSSSQRINPPALRKLMEEAGPDRIIELGGSVDLEPTLSSEALRKAVREDLISEEDAKTLTTRSTSFTRIERYGLPTRRPHD